MRSWWRDAVRLAGVLGALAPMALGLAHPDMEVANASFELEPASARSFPMEVHYHRLVGRLHALAPDTGDLEVLIVDDATWLGHGDAAPAEDAAFVARGDDASVLNHLLRCCDTGYAGYRLIVRNRGERAVAVNLRAWAVHDDFAVVVDRAEPGAVGVPLTIFAVLSGLAVSVALRSRSRRRAGAGVGPYAPGDRPSARSAGTLVPHALRWSIALAVLACVLAVSLGAAGALRYGADPVTGMMAAMADVALPGGPFGSRAALAMGALLLAWCGAVGSWIRAVATQRPGSVRVVGSALGAISLVGGLAMGIAYGALAVPGVLGVVLGVPLIVAAWLAGPRTGGEEPLARLA